MEERAMKCFQFECMYYPKCKFAAGSCCALDDFFDKVTIAREDCYDLEEKPYFVEKKQKKRYGV